MEKLTKECVLQSAARLEQESQDAVMRDIPQFFEAEIVTRFAGAAPQKKELNPLVFNMERGICLAETVDFLRECPALRPYDLILANELDSGCARSGERDTAAEIARALGMQYVFGLEFVELKDAAHGFTAMQSFRAGRSCGQRCSVCRSSITGIMTDRSASAAAMRFLQSWMCRGRRSARYPSIWKTGRAAQDACSR